MPHLHIDDLPWNEWRSPKGRFQQIGKQISEALGAPRNAPVAAGGHPFDLELVRLPPGAVACPHHAHEAQWEMFVILSGTGTVRLGTEGQTLAVRAGSVVLHPPGEAHQLINDGAEELVFYIIADNPPLDVCHYPDSNKWFVRKIGDFRATQVDYFDGEE